VLLALILALLVLPLERERLTLKGFKTLVHAGERLVLQANRSFETPHGFW
jgi:hypothetical protein